MRHFFTWCVMVAACIIIAACGGGGGETTPSSPSTATVKLNTVAKASITAINGVQVTVQMPPGVTVKQDAQGKYATASGSFAGAVSDSRYGAPATGPATLTVIVGSGQDVAVGEFATFTINIPAGTTVTDSSFTIGTPVVSYSPNTGSVDYVPAGQVVVEAQVQ